jgi:hypothetical protein
MVSEIDIEIDGKKLTSIREACSEVSYSRDYVTRLAREGKIVASLIGRQWFVDVLSLKNYAVQSKVEAELRKAQLSEERKQEQIFQKTKQQQKLSHQKSTSSVGTRAVLASGSVLALGLAAGVIGYSVFTTSFGFDFQMSQSQSDGAPNSQLAASAKANAVSPEPNSLAASAPDFSTKAVTAFASAENGILILPQSEGGDPAAVFSDEVHIQTATSGEQTAVLVDTDGVSPDREVPFVLVPVKTAQN